MTNSLPSASTLFPASFKFGIAEADLQIVGEEIALRAEGSEETAWSQFSKTELNAPIGRAIERYDRWEEDLELLVALGVKHYRTSVSVSRLLKRNGDVNQVALTWYRNYFTALRLRGIELYLTLYHWELPAYFQMKGGWANDDVLLLLKRHTEIVHEYLGDLVVEYFAVNEPWCIAMLGHYIGKHSPGGKDLSTALKAAHNVLRAVGVMEKALHARDPNAKLSHVAIVFPTYALTEDPADIAAAERANGFYNTWFLDPIFKGTYPEELMLRVRDYMPPVSEHEMEEIMVGHRLHALGVNFYNGEFVRNTRRAPYDFECVTPTGALTNDLGWPISVAPIYPPALKDGLLELYHTYKGEGLQRLYLSENGMPQFTPIESYSGLPMRDDRRIMYLREHLAQVQGAIAARVPVEGYFLWTFMDNFEWQSHYIPQAAFGLVHIDRASMRRLPKQSYYWYKELIQERRLP